LAEKAQEWLLERNVPETDMHTAMLQRQKAAAVAAGDDGDAGGEADGERDVNGRSIVGRKRAPASGESWRGDETTSLQAGACENTPRVYVYMYIYIIYIYLFIYIYIYIYIYIH